MLLQAEVSVTRKFGKKECKRSARKSSSRHATSPPRGASVLHRPGNALARSPPAELENWLMVPKCPVTRDLSHDFLAVILRLEKPFGSFVETNQHLGSLLLPHRDHRFLQPPENKPWNYWLGAEEVGLSAAEVAAAWEITMNLNDVPLALNFIIFLSRVNWIGVFSGMICCSSGFGCLMV